MPQWPWRKPRPGVDAYGRSDVWHAAAAGDVAAVARALRDGSDPTAADKDGFTALHVAAQNGRLDVAQLLIRSGAQVNVLDRHGNGPLWTATHEASLAKASETNREILSLLLANGADPDQQNAAGRCPRDIAARAPQLLPLFAAPP